MPLPDERREISGVRDREAGDLAALPLVQVTVVDEGVGQFAAAHHVALEVGGEILAVHRRSLGLQLIAAAEVHPRIVAREGDRCAVVEGDGALGGRPDHVGRRAAAEDVERTARAHHRGLRLDAVEEPDIRHLGGDAAHQRQIAHDAVLDGEGAHGRRAGGGIPAVDDVDGVGDRGRGAAEGDAGAVDLRLADLEFRCGGVGEDDRQTGGVAAAARHDRAAREIDVAADQRVLDLDAVADVHRAADREPDQPPVVVGVDVVFAAAVIEDRAALDVDFAADRGTAAREVEEGAARIDGHAGDAAAREPERAAARDRDVDPVAAVGIAARLDHGSADHLAAGEVDRLRVGVAQSVGPDHVVGAVARLVVG